MKNKFINYGKQFIDKSDISNVIKCLKSDYLTQGNLVNDFEKNLSKKFNSKYACVLSNGTAALHLSGIALNWKPKDIVITSPISFVATSNAILYSKAQPIFVDIDNQSFTIDINKLEDKIKSLRKINKKVKTVIGVDYAGHPCDWKSLKYLSNKYNFTLINDNCHAIGAKYFKEIGYAVKYADIVTHSYHPVKNITTGEGGAVLTNNKDIYEKVKLYRAHGISKNLKKNKHPWYYEMNELGFNYRLTDIQSALGISQLKKLDKFCKHRQKIAFFYNSIFNNSDNIIQNINAKNITHAYHFYPLRINFKSRKITKANLFKYLIKNNINLQVHYIPIFMQPYYKKNFNFDYNEFPESINFYNQEISLPTYPYIKKNEINKVSYKILQYINA